MKAHELLICLQAMVCGYEQVLDNLPRANAILASVGKAPLYTAAQENAIMGACERLATICARLRAHLAQEVPVPDLES